MLCSVDFTPYMLCLSVDNVDNFVDNLVYTLGKVKGKHGEICIFMWKRQLLLNIYPQFYPDFPVSVKLFTFLYVFINPIDPGAAPSFILTLSVMTQTRQGETLLPAGLSPFMVYDWTVSSVNTAAYNMYPSLLPKKNSCCWSTASRKA